MGYVIYIPKALEKGFQNMYGFEGQGRLRKKYGPLKKSGPGISRPILAESGDFPWFCRVRTRPGRD